MTPTLKIKCLYLQYLILQRRKLTLFINGFYKDSFFTKKSPVTGSIGIEGRVFKIKLPRVIQGITDLMLTENSGNVGIAMKDFLGASVSQVYILGRVEVRPEYVEEK